MQRNLILCNLYNKIVYQVGINKGIKVVVVVVVVVVVYAAAAVVVVYAAAVVVYAKDGNSYICGTASA